VVSVYIMSTLESRHSISSSQHKGPYDVITLWHVIEHLPNPWEILDAVYASLKPGGVLALASPNSDTF